MAASTPINFTLQSRDWETLVGIIAASGDTDIEEIQFALSTYYRAQTTKPAATDNITIATTEDLVVKLTVYLYGNTVFNVSKDTGGSPFNRIMTAARAANNVADNYISTQLAANDATYNTASNNIKKNGRRIIMMRQYDNQ